MTSSNNDPPQSVVFIDSNVPDLQDLLSGLAPGVEAFVIDSSSDGLAQIATILAANDLSNLSWISIVGHGAAGEVQVGATTLDAGDLSSNSAALAQIGAALAPGGQLQLYSCETGSGAIGQQFIADLSQVAGVGVAASDQEIGQTASGEYWTLDVTAGGAAAASAPFTAQTETDFQGTLTTTDEWINTSGGTWTDTTHAGTNWSLGALPTSTESVAIDQAGSGPYTVTIPTGASATASSVTLSSANATLLDQGTLTLNGALTISAGEFQLSSTGTLSGVTSVSNAGTILQGAQLTLGSGSNPATITNQAGGIYDITGAWGIGQGATGSQFINQGTLERDANGVDGVSYIDVDVTDTGTLNVPDNNPSGANTNLRFDGANNSFSGIYIGGGEVDYGNPNDVGAGIDNLGNIDTQGACTTSWATVNQNGVITLSVGSTIANYGTWNFTSDNGIELNIPQDYSSYAEFTNYGTLATTGSAGTTVMNLAYWNPYYAPSNYNYGGTGLISLAAGTTLAIDPTGNGDIAAYFDNPISGAGTFSIGGGGNDQIESGTSISSGDWTITDAGTDVTLNETLSYAGNFIEQSSATLTLASNLTLTGSANFANATVNGSGTLTTNGTTTISGLTTLSGTVQWQAWNVALTGSLVVSNGTVFDATGSVTGSGSFTIQAGGKFEVGTALTQTLNFSADGILDLVGIHVQSAVVSGSTLTVTETNNSTLTFQTSLPSGDTFGFKSDGGTGTDLTVLSQLLSVGSSPASGTEGQPIALHFSENVAGGATLTSFLISAIPVGATLTDGTPTDTFTASAGNTSVDVHSWNLASLTIRPTTSNSFTLSALATAVDGSGYSYNAGTNELVTVHAAPTVSAGGTATFTGGGSPVTLDSTLSVSDADSGCQLAGATVSISSGFLAGDTLIFSSQNGINGNYNSDTGVLTLCGTASLYDYQTALDSITYNFTAGGDPTGGGSDTARTISWQVTDGVASSAAATSTLDTVHAAPTVTAGGTATFTGGGSPVILDGTLSVSDADSGCQLAGATVSISSGFISGDTLIFCNQNGINGSYNSDTGVLTLCGTASLYDYQTALESISYGFTAGGDPTGGGSDTSRTISWQVTDGSSNNGSSNTSTSALTTVHTAPSVTAGAKASFGGGQAVVLDPKLTVSDADSAGNLSGATVSIGTGFVAGDALHFNTQNGITGSYNSATGVLTLSGTTTLANYQTALDSIAFSSTVATTGSRTIDWQVTDGSSSDGNSNTATSFLGLLTTPIVTAVTANVNATPSESFAASALFSASDGALILGYEVEDESTGVSQGFWVLNGIVLPSGQITELTAGQLSGLSFVSGSVASGSISDTLEVAASDAAGLGPFTTFTVTASHPAPGDVTPVITAANLQEAPNLNLVASSLFSASVPQGETVTSYEVEDTTSDSGHWVFNGVVEPANHLVDVTAAQLSELSFETGYGTDTLMVRANDGTQWGNFATFTVQPPPNPPPPSSTTADMILHDGSGDYEIYDLGKNAILAAGPLGRVGTEWQVVALGGFNGTDTSDMLLRSSVTGAFEIYDISNNNFTNVAAMGQVGLEWQVAGLGDFSSRSGETDMLMRDSATGQFEIYDISNNAITSAASMGQVGTEWQVAGFGDFSSRANETDMLMRNSNTGQFEIYDISNNQLTSAAPMGQVGLEWQVAGFGDFSGNANETDMLMRNSNTGQFEIYDITNNQLASAASMGQVGLEWQVVGFGPINGAGTSDMLMRDSNTGAFEVFNITDNQLTGAAAMGQVGTEWSVAGIAADPPAAPDASTVQLAQTMASFAPSAGALAASSPLDQPSMPATTTPNPLVEPGRPQAS